MGKTALIVTDGAEAIGKMADDIAAALLGCTVKSVTAEKFEGTQLLAADICFFGAEIPNPPSFCYLNKVLNHINLAGRSCGIFSVSKDVLEYLSGMVHDSELALYDDFFLEGDIAAWAKKVASSGGITAWQ